MVFAPYGLGSCSWVPSRREGIKKKDEEKWRRTEEWKKVKTKKNKRENGRRDYVAGLSARNSTHFQSVVRAGRYSRNRSGPSACTQTHNAKCFLSAPVISKSVFPSPCCHSRVLFPYPVVLFCFFSLTSVYGVCVFLVTDVLSVMAPVAFSSSGTNNEESLHHSSADKEVAWHGQVRKKRICSELVLYLLLFFF